MLEFTHNKENRTFAFDAEHAKKRSTAMDCVIHELCWLEKRYVIKVCSFLFWSLDPDFTIRITG